MAGKKGGPTPAAGRKAASMRISGGGISPRKTLSENRRLGRFPYLLSFTCILPLSKASKTAAAFLSWGKSAT